MVATRAPRSPEKALAILLVGAFAFALLLWRLHAAAFTDLHIHRGRLEHRARAEVVREEIESRLAPARPMRVGDRFAGRGGASEAGDDDPVGRWVHRTWEDATRELGVFAEEAEKELGLVAGGGVDGRLEDADGGGDGDPRPVTGGDDERRRRRATR
jgi:hypothetical protein